MLTPSVEDYHERTAKESDIQHHELLREDKIELTIGVVSHAFPEH
jgi:hypothetical protein